MATKRNRGSVSNSSKKRSHPPRERIHSAPANLYEGLGFLTRCEHMCKHTDRSLVVQEIMSNGNELENLITNDEMSQSDIKRLVNLFNQPNFTEETLETTLEVNTIFCYLVKSEFSSSKLNLLKFLTETLDEIEDEKNREVKSSILLLIKIISLLRNFINKFPNQHPFYSDCITLVFQWIKSNYLDSLINTSIKDSIIQLYTKLAKLSQIPEEMEDALNYGNPFRTMDIYPSFQEMGNCRNTKLRALIKEGGYEDVESYLDIHFKLLREDMIYPLRQGIKYLIKLNENFTTKLYTYDHVRITGITAKRAHGLVYKLTFTPYGVKNIKNYNWHRSDRLRFGSLLCFSKKNKKGYPTFKNPLWGVVASQEDEIVKNNQIFVRLKNGFEPDFQFNTDYFMIESREAYFEAYSHTLSVLQNTYEHTLPFKEIFLGISNTCGPPVYIDENAILDFGDLLSGFENQIRVIEEWPICDKLNEGQYRALKFAFLSQVALIQGAPGTGKTHVGFTMLKILLNTREAELKSEFPNEKLKSSLCEQPFVILTHSNNVLDQMLELVKKVELNFVRIGSRSEDGRIKPHTLYEIRKYLWAGGKFSKDIQELQKKQRKVKDELKRIKKIIEKYGKELQSAKKSAKMSISKELLKVIVTKEHFNSLYGSEKSGFKIVVGKNSSICEIWLRELGRNVKLWDEILPQEIHIEKNPFAILAAKDLTIPDENVVDRYLIEERRVEYLELEEKGENDLALNLNKIEQNEKRTDEDIVNEEKILKVATENFKLAMQEIETEYEIPKRILENPDLWAMNQKDRETLYKYWVRRLMHMYSLLIKSYSDRYSAKMKELEAINTSIDLFIIKKATVIGMTTTGAAKHSELIRKLKPRIVIVDEASQVLESHVIASLCASVEHLIMIGDPLMSRPSTAVSRLSHQYNLNLSLFERLIINEFRHATLTLQHRMCPEISSIMQLVYPMLSNQLDPGDYDHIRGVGTNLYFITHNINEDPLKEDSTSKSNAYEAEFVVELARYLVVQGYGQDDVTILTFYSAQKYLIRDMMTKRLGRHQFRVSTVDGFQGEESEVVLLSVVRGNAENIIGHCRVDNRVSVAFSRAKLGFYVIGNENCFRNASKKSKTRLWERILNRFQDMQCIGDKMQLYCVKHGTVCSVGNGKEFRKVNNFGSCFESCINNELREISQECRKSLSCGHPCLGEARDICSGITCTFQTTKQLQCGHSITYICGLSEKKISSMKCEEKCTSILECGHSCQGVCFLCFNSNSHVMCSEKCPHMLTCGHECRAKCHYPLDCPPCPTVVTRNCEHKNYKSVCGEPSILCMENCEWKCEHFECTQSCFDICNRPRCNERCKLVLNCGHPCLGCCGEVCPRICRKCKSFDENLRIYFGDEKHPYANFVLLEDCGHIFEVLGLDGFVKKHLNKNNNQFPCCPKCNTDILNTRRYRHVVNQILINIEFAKGYKTVENKQLLSQNWAKLRVFLSQNTSYEEILCLLEQAPIVQCLTEESTSANLYILSEILRMLQGLFTQNYPLEVWTDDSPLIQFFLSEQLDYLLSLSPKESKKNTRKFLNELSQIYRKCPIYAIFHLIKSEILELWEIKVLQEFKNEFESIEMISSKLRDGVLTQCEVFLSRLNDKHNLSFPTIKYDTSYRRKWTGVGCDNVTETLD